MHRTFNFCSKLTRKNLNGLGLIWASDISARDISALEFPHGDFSAQQHFGPRKFRHGNITVTWTFRYKDGMALGRFGARIFWHMDVLALINFGTMQSKIVISAQIFLQRHFGSVPKHQCAVMLPCRNVHGVAKYPYQNVPAPTYPHTKKSL